MADILINNKINAYLAEHPELAGKSEGIILSCMLQDGSITQSQIDSAKSTSAFGFGFNNGLGMGVTVEKQDVTSVAVREEIPAQENINIYNKSARQGSAAERYIGGKALETVLKEAGIDFTKDYGSKIYERLATIPQEQLDEIKPTDIMDLLSKNKDYETIATSFEYEFGILIRTDKEQQAVENERKVHWGADYKEKEIALQVLANKYDNAIAMLQGYKDSQGLLNIGYYRENFSDILRGLAKLAGLKSEDRNVHFNIQDIIDGLEAKKQQDIASLEKSVHTKSSDFADKFYTLTGTQFKPNLIKEFSSKLMNNEDVSEISRDCFGEVLEDYANETISMTSQIDGAGDIALLLIGADVVGKGIAATFAKPLQKLVAVKGGQIITSAAVGGATLGTWTAFQGSVNAVTKQAPTTEEDLKNIGIASLESFGFGAFGGLLQTTVIQKVIKAVDKPAQKVVQSVGSELKIKGEMSLSDVIKSSVKIQSGDPSKLAKALGFTTEVAGFTGYEITEEVIKDLCNEDGMLPEDMTLEELGSYIGEKFKGQLTGLGSIKAMSSLIMMMKGGRVGQQAAIEYVINSSDLLRDIKVKQTVRDGKMVYEIASERGSRYVESVEDVVKTANSMFTIQTILNAGKKQEVKTDTKPEKAVSEPATEVVAEPEAKVKTEKAEVKPEQKVSETKADQAEQNPLFARLETANDRETFVSIRDEIKKLPEGEEKTQLMQTYLQKYNEWSTDPARPDIRMEYQTLEQKKETLLQKYAEAGCEIAPALEARIKNMPEDAVDAKLEIYEELSKIPDFPKDVIRGILGNTNKDNIELAKQLCADKDFPKNKIGYILYNTNQDNIEFAKQLCADKDFPKEHIKDILFRTTQDNMELAKQLCEDKDFPKEHIKDTLLRTTQYNMELAKQLCVDKDFPKDQISEILSYTNQDNIELAKQLCSDPDFPKDQIGWILYSTNKDNMELAEKLCADKDFPKEHIKDTLLRTTQDNMELAEKLCADKDFPKDQISDILSCTNKDNIELVKPLCADKDFPKGEIKDILYYTNKDNIELAKQLCADKDFPKEHIGGILQYANQDNIEFAKQLCADKDFPKDEIGGILQYANQDNIEFAKQLCADKDFTKEYIVGILFFTNKDNMELAKQLFADKDFPKENIVGILSYTNKDNIELVKQLFADKDLSPLEIAEKLMLSTQNNMELARILSADKDFSKKDIWRILLTLDTYDMSYAKELCTNYKKLEIEPSGLLKLIYNKERFDYKQYLKLQHKIGRDNIAKMSDSDLTLACRMVELCGKKSINEIPQHEKKDILRLLVASNIGLFEASDELRKMFPLLPKNQEEYCSLLPSIVRSLGIETKALTPEQRITVFNTSMKELSKNLASMADDSFSQMRVTQEYTKDEFIKDVLGKVKELSKEERQKVYDYFGFELHHNKNNPTRYSITGYPVNLNNGKKLAQIENPQTKAIVEELRPLVIKFSENNRVICEADANIEQLLNEVVSALPELRTAIGRTQHGNNGTQGAQDYDVMQHSLKVMQKIAQDPKFETLNASDQKIMLLASLMHDITKKEGSIDKLHANESSFDTYFIAQKFHLTKDEEVKLHTLIKCHEWLEYANTAKNEKELTKRLQSIAYDLHQGNLFDMAEIFTHADLRAVKRDDSFHNTKTGASRVSFDGTVRSYGESADVYAERIRGYIQELKTSQPLLPQTKLPRASRINQAITVVNPDGSTNIKGVYKNKDGLVIIKYNEVEDWESLGFPQGSISHGIEIHKGEKGDAQLSEEVNTGNIKFFVHGLDYANQLAKFDAFSLVDSDALLSVSYAERPESKFRFFRAQGVILDVNSKYIHGGGNTDAGSGCGKNISEFKNHYIFGGHREADRLYVSDLIKRVTGMSDSEYVEFFEANKNRSLSEIEPAEIREKIIKAFATINSNTRKGDRSYNEMYISNPNEVMGVFAYNIDYNEKIGNPVNFLSRTQVGAHENGYNGAGSKSAYERTEFLQKYALERDLPFIIFGD